MVTGDRGRAARAVQRHHREPGDRADPAGTVSGIAFQVDGNLVTWSDQRTAALAPGESATLEAVGGPAVPATWTATAGRHRLRAFVDDAHRIGQSDEGNNSVTRPWR